MQIISLIAGKIMTGYYKTKRKEAVYLPLLLLCPEFHPDILSREMLVEE